MLSAAVNAGADAVYFGLKEFSMRQNAGNFTIKDLNQIEQICKFKGRLSASNFANRARNKQGWELGNHWCLRKVKRYLTLNTIIYNSELKQIEEIIKKIKNKVDAIICWDAAVIQFCKKYKIPFFISTQASVANVEAARFYKKLGAKRIILARELNLKQIKEISKIIDVEAFCHGALCVAISGRCLTSQFLFNKSANRGECLHPCRRSYIVKDEEGNELRIENSKILSAKDLCTLPFIEKMKNSGIKSFKIEGRNRDARYVDTVVRIYRKALDKTLTKEEIEEETKELEKIYNKGYSSGFYIKMPTADDFAKIEHSASKKKKHFVGKVTHYFPDVHVAAIKLVSDLSIGDEIVIIGKTTGLVSLKIDSIQISRKPIKKAKKGNEIGIKTSTLVRKNDEVYLIKKINQ
jgi:putative protease